MLRRTLRPALIAAALLPAACSYNAFSATRTEPISIAVEGASALHCETHNGAVSLRTGDGEAIRGEVELTARGATQEEADRLLPLIVPNVTRDRGTIKLGWRWSDGRHPSRSGDAAFSLQIPSGLRTQLSTHNGNITLAGATEPCRLDSHNGDIAVDGNLAEVRAETHNGDIHIALTGAGAVDAEVDTHNGNVQLGMAERSAQVVVDTHNGSIAVPERADVRRRKSSFVEATFGSGDGRVRIDTHNGAVRIR